MTSDLRKPRRMSGSDFCQPRQDDTSGGRYSHEYRAREKIGNFFDHASAPQACHRLSGLNREHSFSNLLKILESSRDEMHGTSFGTRGSQV